jgi:hypothetical protein
MRITTNIQITIEVPDNKPIPRIIPHVIGNHNLTFRNDKRFYEITNIVCGKWEKVNK